MATTNPTNYPTISHRPFLWFVPWSLRRQSLHLNVSGKITSCPSPTSLSSLQLMSWEVPTLQWHALSELTEFKIKGVRKQTFLRSKSIIVVIFFCASPSLDACIPLFTASGHRRIRQHFIWGRGFESCLWHMSDIAVFYVICCVWWRRREKASAAWNRFWWSGRPSKKERNKEIKKMLTKY